MGGTRKPTARRALIPVFPNAKSLHSGRPPPDLETPIHLLPLGSLSHLSADTHTHSLTRAHLCIAIHLYTALAWARLPAFFYSTRTNQQTSPSLSAQPIVLCGIEG